MNGAGRAGLGSAPAPESKDTRGGGTAKQGIGVDRRGTASAGKRRGNALRRLRNECKAAARQGKALRGQGYAQRRQTKAPRGHRLAVPGKAEATRSWEMLWQRADPRSRGFASRRSAWQGEAKAQLGNECASAWIGSAPRGHCIAFPCTARAPHGIYRRGGIAWHHIAPAIALHGFALLRAGTARRRKAKHRQGEAARGKAMEMPSFEARWHGIAKIGGASE